MYHLLEVVIYFINSEGNDIGTIGIKRIIDMLYYNIGG